MIMPFICMHACVVNPWLARSHTFRVSLIYTFYLSVLLDIFILIIILFGLQITVEMCSYKVPGGVGGGGGGVLHPNWGTMLSTSSKFGPYRI